ncbi:beta strand repeat-containing protein [Burkholderia cenocepacia]|uniref:beta strand repeat-containing protein n=1 Tax=Burkholderia cenocepacia TaxID=95486 RepID=UPI000760F0D8|nr:choice-of-anchor D domain-containing protein [Burkholderia cenocepacia]KWU17755.1 hypothetical protein AS149_13625 [Burkholderia cenocepacia]
MHFFRNHKKRLSALMALVVASTTLLSPLADAATASYYRIPLKSDGVAPGVGKLQISPGSIAFADQKIGTTSASQTVSLANTGNTDVTLEAPVVAGPFAATTNCGSVLAAASSCTYSVTYTASSMGAETGALQVPSSAGPQSVVLSGYGLRTSDSASVGSLAFSQAVGTASSPKSVTLTNTGNTSVAISGVTIAGAPYQVSHNCPDTLAAGSSCVANVTFSPTAMGDVAGTLTFATAAGQQLVALTGTGLLAVPDLAPGSLSFADQNVNTTSGTQPVTLSNKGNTPLAVSPATVDAPFVLKGTTCGDQLDAGAACTFDVAFAPTVMGQASGALHVPTSTGALLATVSGKGLQTSSGLQGGDLNFGSVKVATTSPAQGVTLRNTGNTALGVSSISNTGPFSITHDCPASVAAGSSCNVNVTFKPTVMGQATGVATIVTNGGTQTFTLAGVGTQPALVFSPTSLAYGNVQVGQTAAKAVTVTNSGTADATGITMAVPTGYSYASTCGSTLASGASCSVTVTFSPTVVQAYPAGVLAFNANETSGTVALSGTGTAQSLTNMTGSGINLGTNLPADSSSGQYFTFKNTGSGPVTIGTNGLVSGSVYLWTGGTIGDGTCNNNTVLAAGASCNLYVYLGSAGSYSATVFLNSSAGQKTFAVTGTAVAPYFTDSNTGTRGSVPFGSIKANTSAARWVILTNPANDAFRNVAVTASWPYSISQSNCTNTLAAGASCSFVLTFNSGSNVGTWNGAYLVTTGYHYQMNGGVEQASGTPGNVTYSASVTGTGSPFCTPGAAAWTSNGTFYPGSSAPNCSTFLVLVVGGGGGGARPGASGSYGPYSGGGGAGYVGVQWANGITGAIGVTVGGGGGPDAAGGTSCFGGICSGGGNPGSQNGPGGAGGSGGGYGSPNIAGAGGSWGGNSTDGNGPGEGNYSGAVANFRYNSITGGAGGAPGSNQVNTWGGGGGGGILFNGGGPSGGTGFYGYPFTTMGAGGVGYGGGGGGGYYHCLSQCQGTAGGGAAGLVYVEWYN